MPVPGVYSDAYIQRLLTLRLSRSTLRASRSRHMYFYNTKSPSEAQIGPDRPIPLGRVFGPPGDPQETLREPPASSRKRQEPLRKLSEISRKLQDASGSSTKLSGGSRELHEAPGTSQGSPGSSQKAPGRSQAAPEKLSGSSQEARGDQLYIITSFGSETPDSSPLATRMLK